jgi:O-antigen/teichoic acid export membrane protein
VLEKFKQKYDNNKELFWIAILSGISSFIKIVTSFISGKAIAVYTGTNGMAMIGQLQNFINLILQVSTGAASNGITKYVSQYHKTNAVKSIEIIRTGVAILVWCSTLVALVNFVLCKQLAIWLLNDASFYYIFLVLGVTIILFAYNNLILAILNGLGLYKTLFKVNILTNFIGMLFTAVLSYWYGLEGALLAIATAQSLVFVYTIWVVKGEVFVQHIKPVFKANKVNVRLLVMFSLMAITSAIVVPVSQLYIRNYIIQTHGTHQAGLWEALNRISGLILVFVTLPLNTYYLPKISATHSYQEIKKEVVKVFWLLSAILIAMLTSIFLLRVFMLKLLFSSEFLPMQDLFVFQFVGDYIKIISWIFCIILIAKAKTTVFIITEVFTAFLNCVLNVYFINKIGIQGAQVAYTVTYFCYLVILLAYFYVAYHRKQPEIR